MLDLPRTVHLRGGAAVLLRPIRSEDAPALTRLYDRLSPESAYQRFFAVMRRLPPDWARILADVDHDRRAAIAALGPGGELVGVARYSVLEDPGEAEIALVVEDAWQGRGLGTILLSALFEHAESRGIARFLAYVLADNQRMMRLIERVGRLTARSLSSGVASLRFTHLPVSPGGPPAQAPA